MAKPERARRFDYRYFAPITTRWADNDIYGHVNNVVYYSYFDSIANLYLIEVAGLKIQSDNVVGFVVSSGCTYYLANKPVLSSNNSLPVTDKYSGEIFAEAALATPEVIDRAIAAEGFFICIMTLIKLVVLWHTWPPMHKIKIHLKQKDAFLR